MTRDRGRFNPVLVAIGLIVAIAVIWLTTGGQRGGPLEDVVIKAAPESSAEGGNSQQLSAPSSPEGGTAKQLSTQLKPKEQTFPPLTDSTQSRAKANEVGDGQQGSNKTRRNPYYRTPEEQQAAIDAAEPIREQVRANLKKQLSDEDVDKILRSR
ncbi:MAG: hypothetical protein GXP09_00100 [Gammaproteobacteria bacterium]|nr:hypothetical protein [Gammaproteobacteria bacterium]